MWEEKTGMQFLPCGRNTREEAGLVLGRCWFASQSVLDRAPPNIPGGEFGGRRRHAGAAVAFKRAAVAAAAAAGVQR